MTLDIPPAIALDRFDEVLTPEAIAFVARLARAFAPRLTTLLAARATRRKAFAAGAVLDFDPATQSIRDGDWRVAEIPRDLQRRIVEITGPVDRKMIINALNSGADAFMADFEDATAPTWRNLLDGQVNLRDAVRRTIAYTDPATSKSYSLADSIATLIVRPRGLHLTEAHFTVDGEAIPGALFDAALFLFHNARELIERGSGPYLYLPKLEHADEAAWWNDVFVLAEEVLQLERGVIKATVLIETLPAAFQMHEILFALREHAAGLNCGRWDYIFSFIKTRRDDARAVLPDRVQVTMTQPNMRAYTQLVVRTCHRRGAFAMGGMAAQIPVKNDPAANDAALERVRADKLREVMDGHDGTWVAHPALVATAREAFASHMSGDNQLDRLREDVHVTTVELLQTPSGTRTEDGLRLNVRVGVQYIEAWLRGNGAVPLYHMMEDAATAEISRTQLWQWIRHGAALDDGRVVTREMVARIVDEERERIGTEVGADRMRTGRFADAVTLFLDLVNANELPEFLTLSAYPLLDELRPKV
ncbi:MAG TPA: malate synthase A, partial [Gemmatimonadaceae bacterium]|nr:malate synthase A [Gemmatimonadaceae bacterium]